MVTIRRMNTTPNYEGWAKGMDLVRQGLDLANAAEVLQRLPRSLATSPLERARLRSVLRIAAADLIENGAEHIEPEMAFLRDAPKEDVARAEPESHPKKKSTPAPKTDIRRLKKKPTAERLSDQPEDADAAEAGDSFRS